MTKLDLKYTIFDKANGVYLYQRAVPENAVWLIQRKKITASLGKTAHEARTRYLPTHTKWQDAIDRAIASIVGEPDDDELMDRVVEFLNGRAALSGGSLEEIDWTLNWNERTKLWKQWQEWNAVRDGTTTGDQFEGDNDLMLDRLIEGWKMYKAAIRGRVALSAQLPVELSNANQPTQDGQIIMSLTDLEKKWLKEKKRSVAAEADMKRMVKLFTAINGNLSIHDVQAKHKIAFRDAVQTMKDKGGRPIKAQTQNKLMRTVAGLGSYAEKLGVVTVNPLRAVSFEVTDEMIRESFSDAIIKQIFKSDAWKNRSEKYRDFIRWFFILGAYTGARIGEIAQLRAEDVYKHEGIWCIEITNDEVTGQSTKTDTTRLVPVSKHLIEYGFLKFIQKIGNGQLFPEIKRGKHNGAWSQYVSPKVSAVLRGAGLSKEYTGHSWRHTIKTRLRSKVPDSVNDWITHPRGRKQSVASKYGRVEVIAMKRAVDGLVYRVEWPKV